MLHMFKACPCLSFSLPFLMHLFSSFLSLSSSLELSSDPGKTLPESLDYNVFWLQTVAGEVDSKTGIPPPLLCLQIKDFLNGPGGVHAQQNTNALFNACNFCTLTPFLRPLMLPL